jgi:hypothetical protein
MSVVIPITVDGKQYILELIDDILFIDGKEVILDEIISYKFTGDFYEQIIYFAMRCIHIGSNRNKALLYVNDENLLIRKYCKKILGIYEI